MNRFAHVVALALPFCIYSNTFGASTVFYVDPVAGSNGNGLTWATAHRSLDAALLLAAAAAPEPVEIHIAGGTLRPATTGTATPKTFTVRGNVALLGGYAGVEYPNPDVRDLSQFQTVLSGDINGDDNGQNSQYADNSTKLIVTGADATGITFDGISFESARSAVVNSGGHLRFAGCSFLKCSASGNRVITLEGGSIELGNCVIRDCGKWPSYSGSGAITNYSGGRLVMTGCRILGNNLTYGAAYSDGADSQAVLVNCLIANNTCGYAAIRTSGALSMTNCSVLSNLRSPNSTQISVTSGGVSAMGPTAFNNCIFWNNRNEIGGGEGAQIDRPADSTGTLEIHRSCVEGWSGVFGGVGNFGDDPRFVDPYGANLVEYAFDGDYRLSDDSPCLDAGDNEVDTDLVSPGVQPIPGVDLNGAPRFVDEAGVVDSGNGAPPIVDIGPYEGTTAQVRVSGRELVVPEGGTASFGVWLNRAPIGVVTVSVSAIDTGSMIIQSGGTLQFDSQNYGSPQPVTIRSLADPGFFRERVRFRLSAGSYAAATVTTEQEDLTPVPSIVFVNQAATGPESGTSWSGGFRLLQKALDAAAEFPQIESIWVARGHYHPSKPTDAAIARTRTFSISQGLTLYGGFAGTETSIGQRNPAINETMLCGDLFDNDQGGFEDASRSENCLHVVSMRYNVLRPTLDGFTIKGGRAVPTSGSSPLLGDGGGGLLLRYSGGKFVNCRFTGNHARNYGGALYGSSPDDIEFVNCKFMDNVADGGTVSLSRPGGGAIHLSSSGSVALEGCEFRNNLVNGESPSGGAMTFSGESLALSHTLFQGNKATSTVDYPGSYGGAVYLYRGDLAATDCEFRQNEADRAGVIDSSESETSNFTRCSFVSNKAYDSYSVGDLSSGGSVLIDTCSFFGNVMQGSSSSSGRMFAISASSISVMDSGFRQNSSTTSDYGGILFSAAAGQGLISNCTFESNTGRGNVIGSVSQFRVENCTFSNNTFSQNYGLVAWYSDIVNCRFLKNLGTSSTSSGSKGVVSLQRQSRMIGCQVQGNTSGRGGAVTCENDYEIGLINTTITRNSTSMGAGGVTFLGTRANVNNCIIVQNGVDISGQPASIRNSCISTLPSEYVGHGNFSDDPMFVDLDGVDNVIGTLDDDPSLLPSSPCVNKGDNLAAVFPEVDILGNERVQACRIDIGAAETDGFTLIDCNENGLHDDCEILDGLVQDCNHNNVVDKCDVGYGNAADANLNGVPDVCEHRVIYVDQHARAGGDGSTWELAFRDLQAALSSAADYPAAVDIWVAKGFYHPGDGPDPEAAFLIPANTSLFGGFAGFETDAAQRVPGANPTVLTGDNAGDDGTINICCDADPTTGCLTDACRERVCQLIPSCCTDGWTWNCARMASLLPSVYQCGPCAVRTDNSRQVLELAMNAAGVVDGFTIEGAVTGWPETAAIHCYRATVTFRNCRVTGNHYYGVLIEGGVTTFEDCEFSGNFSIDSLLDGSALYVYLGAQVLMIRCSLTDNGRYALLAGGNSSIGLDNCFFDRNPAAILINGANLEGRNCLIRGSGAIDYGSFAISLTGQATATLDHLTVSGNNRGGVYSDSYSSLVVTNSILYGNTHSSSTPEYWQIFYSPSNPPIVRNTCIEGIGALAGNGNIGDSPMFVNAAAGDFHLAAGSPCRDAGSAAASPSPVEFDLDGNPRLMGCEVDMGAYEIVSGAAGSGDFDGDGLVTLGDVVLFIDVLLSPSDSGSCVGDLDGSGSFDGGDLQMLVDRLLM